MVICCSLTFGPCSKGERLLSRWSETLYYGVNLKSNHVRGSEVWYGGIVVRPHHVDGGTAEDPTKQYLVGTHMVTWTSLRTVSFQLQKHWDFDLIYKGMYIPEEVLLWREMFLLLTETFLMTNVVAGRHDRYDCTYMNHNFSFSPQWVSWARPCGFYSSTPARFDSTYDKLRTYDTYPYYLLNQLVSDS